MAKNYRGGLKRDVNDHGLAWRAGK